LAKDYLVNIDSEVFYMAVVPLNTGEKTSHRNKLVFRWNGFVLQEAWGVGNEAAGWEDLGFLGPNYMVVCRAKRLGIDFDGRQCAGNLHDMAVKNNK
jgi:hypothetical protein